jgi:hypothetical protein
MPLSEAASSSSGPPRSWRARERSADIAAAVGGIAADGVLEERAREDRAQPVPLGPARDEAQVRVLVRESCTSRNDGIALEGLLAVTSS